MGPRSNKLQVEEVIIADDDGDEYDHAPNSFSIDDKRYRDSLFRLEQRILRQIAGGEDADRILENLCLECEAVLGNALCTILLSDNGGTDLRVAAAPGLPGEMVAVWPALTNAAGAAGSGEPVISEDIQSLSAWLEHRGFAESCGFRSCWAWPQHSRSGAVEGVLAVATGRPGAPEDRDRELLRLVEYLAGIAVNNARSRDLLGRYEEMVSSSRDMMAYVDRNYEFKAVSISLAEFQGFSRDEVIGRTVAEIVGQDIFENVIKERLDRSFRGESVVREGWRQMTDRESRHISTHYDPIVEDGEVIGVVIVARDTTENRLIEEALRESEERFALAMRGLNVGLWDWNPATDEMYYSPTWGKMLGYSDETYVGTRQDFHQLVHEDDREHVIATMMQFAASGEELFSMEFRLLHRDGRYLDILSRGYGVRDETGGGIRRVVGINTDITERKQAETRLQESETRFRSLYDDSPTMFFTLDTNGIIRSLNRFGADHLGYTVRELVGTNINKLVHDEDLGQLRQQLTRCAGEGENLYRHEFRAHHKFGDLLWVRATLRKVSREGETDILISCEDVTETRILSEQLEYQAKHDSLTGLINRAEFERRLRRVLNSHGADNEHALCYLDLDQFKIINDTCGHLAGDELLRRVSHLLGRAVRKRDTLARLGGDEFAILLEHCPLEQAMRVATEVLDGIHDLRFTWEGKRFNLGVTIGLVPINEHSGTVTDVLSAADAACYAAKDAGRNRIHVYHSDDSELSKRRGEMQWVSEINRALEEQRLCLARQPIIPLSGSGKARAGGHYELLVRMKKEDGDLAYPGAFLPAAERYNLAILLDRWVVSSAFAWLLDNPDELASLQMCAINLSGHSLGDPDFLRFLLEKFQEEHIEAENFCFEITETAAIANLGNAIHFITTLKSIGCSFALDDFGTGLSSFNYLKNLPVDYLKIDGSFISEISRDPIDRAMVQSINEIGHVMGKETIAEFVESEEILEILREIGVDHAQGFHVGRPELLE